MVLWMSNVPGMENDEWNASIPLILKPDPTNFIGGVVVQKIVVGLVKNVFTQRIMNGILVKKLLVKHLMGQNMCSL